MSTFKYVMFEDGRFILIPQSMKHSDVVRSNQREDVHSAGFVKLRPIKNAYGQEYLESDCYGESISLDKKCDKQEDEKFIDLALRR